MSADYTGGYDEVEPESEQDPKNRRNAGIWGLLATVLVAAIVLLIVLTQCVPRVPDVVELTEKQAVTKLTQAGYQVGAVSRVVLPDTSAGKVAEQAPEAGAVFSRGGSVDLVVALGAELVEVPEVIGNDTSAAELLIKAKQLVMEVEGRYSPSIPAGAVISQNPPANAKVPVGSRVVLVVSLGIEPETGFGDSASPVAGASFSAGNGGSGSSGPGSTQSNCTASYPGATVWASGGDIYIRTGGIGTRQLTSGSAWDSRPLLSPNAKYVVFMRAPSSGAKADGIGRVCLTTFEAQIMKMPWSTQMTTGHVWYESYAFAPSPTGTAPGSDWLVISQLYEYPLTTSQNPDPAQNVRGRLAVCNVPIASSWVGWNVEFFPTAGISLSRSTTPGCVKVTAIRPDGKQWVREFNAHTGMFLK